MNITIFGAGVFGLALGKILESKSHSVTFYDPFKFPDLSLEKSLEGSELMILSVPSDHAGEVLKKIPGSFRHLPFIIATKGLFTSKPFQNFENISILSGPAFAQDLNSHKPTTLTATSKLIIDLFQTSWLKFDHTDDVDGVLLCGTFKNIYAIEAGRRGLKKDTDDFDAYIKKVCAELKTILSENLCDPKTVDLACGIGDMILTCSSDTSRNYQFGQNLAENPDTHHATQTTEGLTALCNLEQNSIAIPKTAKTLQQIKEKLCR